MAVRFVAPNEDVNSDQCQFFSLFYFIFLFIYIYISIFTNIHEPEANNCFSIITQVIIEIPKQRNLKILFVIVTRQ